MALNLLVSVISRLVARSGRKRGNRQTDRQTDRQNDKATTVNLSCQRVNNCWHLGHSNKQNLCKYPDAPGKIIEVHIQEVSYACSVEFPLNFHPPTYMYIHVPSVFGLWAASSARGFAISFVQ